MISVSLGFWAQLRTRGQAPSLQQIDRLVLMTTKGRSHDESSWNICLTHPFKNLYTTGIS